MRSVLLLAATAIVASLFGLGVKAADAGFLGDIGKRNLGLTQAPPPAPPEPGSFKHHSEHNVDNHVIGYADVNLKANGEGSVYSLYSNGNQWTGRRFVSEMWFVDKNKKRMFVVFHQRYVSPSHMRGARERSAVTPLHLTAEQMAMLDHVEVKITTTKRGFLNPGTLLDGLADYAHTALFGGDTEGNIPEAQSSVLPSIGLDSPWGESAPIR